jgi:hypothetical protein
MMASDSKLTDDRLASIEQGARERHTLMDRVIVELVEEVRRLRGVVAEDPANVGERTDPEHPQEPT